ncbi:acyl transferase domain-containing protein/acyl carrier protein [Flavobacterium sp. HSC-32F16]|uniref:type I polyketide synthase n=1 Tax=Flavobacterium sp. HSC-32F16 TaxID=2910964 RepID=UPI0020A5C488|nr:type I polyketide synthase [Flavobacterium sp. HSC-32F16]MCP2028485.1 acyl transferase domain-containing protein/acyl carrier protein [Flavobacterium sp. HSC-32F16]
MMKNDNKDKTGLELAIIGISCRVPGADNWREFWNNLLDAKESIHFYNDDELENLGVDKTVFSKKDYVKAKSVVNNKGSFDNLFFKYSIKEAALMNPTHRMFHENVWEALEDSGYTPDQVKGKISLYAGVGDDTNWKAYAMMKNRDGLIDDLTLNFISSKDHLASLIAYKLNLQGAAYSINTACSSSLAAIHLACRGLLMGESKLAVAGGISLDTSIQKGYEYQEELIYSSDGHCRTFDDGASGTVGSEGSGVVILKKLSDAIEDNDHIYAVIKGSAANNDGNRKVGYAAPSITGQTECIKTAHKLANVEAETIEYIEAHGTGTKIGDPIEVEALNLAFNNNSNHNCALGSVKTNFGHTDSASGVIGLIKTALSLKYKKIPPTLHYKKANSEIYFDEGPFYVNAELKEWKGNGQPLRAGVSSFGIGGTNVHLILEEAPEPIHNIGEIQKNRVLTVSAKTSSSLKKYLNKLHTFLEMEDLDLDNLIYTYRVGRTSFNHRIALEFKDKNELLNRLSENYDRSDLFADVSKKKKTVFLFPGLGSQYSGMVKDIYENQNVFKEKIDEGCNYLKELTGEDFKAILFSENEKIEKQKYAEPLLFLVEYSLAYLLKSFNVLPDYVLGQNIGEYAAAAVSEIFTFEEGLKLMILKSNLLNEKNPNILLSAFLTEEEAEKFINKKISLAVVNGTQQVTFSGMLKEIDDLSNQLSEMGIMNSKLQKKHIDYSNVNDSFKKQFISFWNEISINKMKVPFVSSVTAKLVTDEEAAKPEYWLNLITETSRFYNSIAALTEKEKDLVFIEVGSGNTLEKLIKRETISTNKKAAVINLTRQSKDNADDSNVLQKALVELWYDGINVNWAAYYDKSKYKRISLPVHPFETNQFPSEVEPFKAMFETKTPSYAASNISHTRKDEIIVSEPIVEEDIVLNKLKKIFKDFFDIEEVKDESDFIELGLNSLNGMLLLKNIKTEFKIDFTLHEFFECESIVDITSKIVKFQSNNSHLNSYKTITI